MVRELTHFIGGEHVEGSSGRFGDVFDPSTGEVQASVPFASAAEVRHAIDLAERAQLEWGAFNPQRRARVLMRFLELVARDLAPPARLPSSRPGQTNEDAKGDIQRGVEVIEFSLGAPHLLKGEYTTGAGAGIARVAWLRPSWRWRCPP